MNSPLWISEADVVAMMDIGDAITALEKALLAAARGEAKAPRYIDITHALSSNSICFANSRRQVAASAARPTQTGRQPMHTVLIRDIACKLGRVDPTFVT